MSERAARTIASHPAARTIAAFVAAAALLLQFLMPAPALLARGVAWPADWQVRLCAAGTSANNLTDHTRSPQSPAAPHSHDNCPVCQSRSVPLAILIAVVPPGAETTGWWRLLWDALTVSAHTRPFRLYSSRAPPVTA